MDPNANQNIPLESPQIPLNPVPPVQSPTVEPVSPIVTPKRRVPKKLLILVLLIVLAGVGIVLFNKTKNTMPDMPQEEEQVAPVFEEYPDFSGIPINETTVSFLKADGKFCLLYKGIIYTPQDSGSFLPKAKDLTAEMEAFPWIGLVDAPNNLVSDGGAGDAVFSFKETPSNRSFVFIMRWDTVDGEQYHMFRFNNNTFSELRVFNQDQDGLYYSPRLHSFSPGGNYVALNMFRCPGCLSEVPETQLYYIPSKDVRDLGQVSYFNWREDDNTYEYKDYEEGVDPANMPLLVNEFFEDSVNLLTP